MTRLVRFVSLQHPTSFPYGRKRLNELANTQTVHVRHAAEIDDKVDVPGLQGASNGIGQRRPRRATLERDFAADRQHDDIAVDSLHELHDVSVALVAPPPRRAHTAGTDHRTARRSPTSPGTARELAAFPYLARSASTVASAVCRRVSSFMSARKAALRVRQRERAKRAVRLLDLERDLGPVNDAFLDLPLPRGLGADRAAEDLALLREMECERDRLRLSVWPRQRELGVPVAGEVGRLRRGRGRNEREGDEDDGCERFHGFC